MSKLQDITGRTGNLFRTLAILLAALVLFGFGYVSGQDAAIKEVRDTSTEILSRLDEIEQGVEEGSSTASEARDAAENACEVAEEIRDKLDY